MLIAIVFFIHKICMLNNCGDWGCRVAHIEPVHIVFKKWFGKTHNNSHSANALKFFQFFSIFIRKLRSKRKEIKAWYGNNNFIEYFFFPVMSDCNFSIFFFNTCYGTSVEYLSVMLFNFFFQRFCKLQKTTFWIRKVGGSFGNTRPKPA